MRIGEVAEQTGLSISNIRFYEKKGLIKPDREVRIANHFRGRIHKKRQTVNTKTVLID